MAQYSIISVSLSPPHFKWATTQIMFRASLHCVFNTLICFLKKWREYHQSPRNFVDSSIGRSVLPIFIVGGLRTLDRGAVKCMTLHLWAGNWNHSYIAFTTFCKCLSMVSRERPRKHFARSSTNSALRTSLAICEFNSSIFSPKHVTARTPLVGTPSSG